jgi:hypothetical protein
MESAALAITATLSSRTHTALTDLGGTRHILLLTGVAIVSVAALLAVFAVAPQLKGLATDRPRRRTSRDRPLDFIYFGHVRAWSPEQLTAALRASDPLPVLSRQLVVMSQVAWRKHRCVQGSLAAAAVGSACIALAGLLTDR